MRVHRILSHNLETSNTYMHLVVTESGLDAKMHVAKHIGPNHLVSYNGLSHEEAKQDFWYMMYNNTLTQVSVIKEIEHAYTK